MRTQTLSKFQNLKGKFAKAVLNDKGQLTNTAFTLTCAAGIVPALAIMPLVSTSTAALGVFVAGFYAGTGAAALMIEKQETLQNWAKKV